MAMPPKRHTSGGDQISHHGGGTRAVDAHHSRMAPEGPQARMDAITGAREAIEPLHKVRCGADHIVGEGLRRGIGDAYAAFIGQTDKLPNDTYGLALFALQRAYPVDFYEAGQHDFNLYGRAPFVTSKVKHATICNKAHNILRNLDDYVHKVYPYTPAPLNGLTKRPRHKSPHATRSRGPTLRPGQQDIGLQRTHPDRRTPMPPTDTAASGQNHQQQHQQPQQGAAAGRGAAGQSRGGTPVDEGVPRRGLGMKSPSEAVATQRRRTPVRGASGASPAPGSQQTNTGTSAVAATAGAAAGQGREVTPTVSAGGAAVVAGSPADLAAAAVTYAAGLMAAQKRTAKQGYAAAAGTGGAAAGSQQPHGTSGSRRPVRYIAPNLRVSEYYQDRSTGYRCRSPPARLRSAQPGDVGRVAAALGLLPRPVSAGASGPGGPLTLAQVAGSGVVPPGSKEMALAHKVLGTAAPDTQYGSMGGAAGHPGQPGQEAYPYRAPSPGGGVMTSAHPLLRPGESVASCLGLTVSDAQLLRIIRAHRNHTQRHQRVTSPPTNRPSPVYTPDGGASGCCSPERSLRLQPTDEELQWGRNLGVPVAALRAGRGYGSSGGGGGAAAGAGRGYGSSGGGGVVAGVGGRAGGAVVGAGVPGIGAQGAAVGAQGQVAAGAGGHTVQTVHAVGRAEDELSPNRSRRVL